MFYSFKKISALNLKTGGKILIDQNAYLELCILRGHRLYFPPPPPQNNIFLGWGKGDCKTGKDTKKYKYIFVKKCWEVCEMYLKGLLHGMGN